MGNFDGPSLGPVCPLCGKNWSDGSSCGPPSGMSWREQNEAGMFLGRSIRGPRTVTRSLHECAVCFGVFEAGPAAIYCSGFCRKRAERQRAGRAGLDANLAAVRRYQARKKTAAA